MKNVWFGCNSDTVSMLHPEVYLIVKLLLVFLCILYVSNKYRTGMEYVYITSKWKVSQNVLLSKAAIRF